ncbi:MAG: hypothetical protein ABFS03_00750 [Chloroflexota bacterium]
MNKNNAKDYLPLVQALADGKQIQHSLPNSVFRDMGELRFDSPPERYRVKPEPREFWYNESYILTEKEYESEKWDKSGPFIKLIEVLDD